jgi:hypothetical protein
MEKKKWEDKQSPRVVIGTDIKKDRTLIDEDGNKIELKEKESVKKYINK